jgi:hypothetical protein
MKRPIAGWRWLRPLPRSGQIDRCSLISAAQFVIVLNWVRQSEQRSNR